MEAPYREYGIIQLLGRKDFLNMKSDLTIKNRYCTIPQAKFRKWDEMDVLLWKLGKNDSRRRSGVYQLNAYKDAYVQSN